MAENMNNNFDVDKAFREEAIDFFKDLIVHRNGLKIDTRPVNFAGNIGRHMSKELKQWFLNKYPNSSDYVKFFHENDTLFHYDCISGNVSLIVGGVKPFERPERLTRLEDMCSDPEIDLRQMSENVSELEFLIVMFKTFVESYRQKKTIELQTQRLAEEFSQQKYQLMFGQLSKFMANPLTGHQFETNLMKYLDENYSQIFVVDKQKNRIRFQLRVIECLRKVSQTMDDSIYKILEALLIKYLQRFGPKDVDQLNDQIRNRHPFIMDHIFHQTNTVDDYTLLDFCRYNDKFVLKLEESEECLLRLIDVKREPIVEQNIEPNIEVVVISDDEIYNSDDDIYYSEDDNI